MNAVRIACLISFGTGFLSLSQEILFVRLVGFMFSSTPEAFAFVLACFLTGIGIGAGVGKRICSRPRDLRHAAAVALLAAGAGDVLVPWIAAAAAGSLYAPPVMATMIIVTAALKSTLFPVAHQLGAETGGDRLGRSISRVYASNIAGSSLGPLVTGFWLLDHIDLERCFIAVAFAVFALAAAAFGGGDRRPAFAALLGSFAVLAVASTLPARMMNRIVAAYLQPGLTVGQILEHRSGIVHTIATRSGGDIVFGGNVFDGRINTSLVTNSNGIDRVYILPLFHPRPRRVLVIGLSTGAWTQVVAMLPDVERIDVIEINPVYLRLIGHYREVSPLLDDPRVRVHFDDGRRWLRRHPQERYDLIVMNTTLHWRAYSTNLLSREFMQIARRHLAPGGLFAFNTTDSPDAAWTAASVFPFVRLFTNAAYCAEHDFTRHRNERVARLWDLAADGVPALDRHDEHHRAAVEKLAGARLVDPAERIKHVSRPVVIVTDDNMATEYRFGRPPRLFPQL